VYRPDLFTGEVAAAWANDSQEMYILEVLSGPLDGKTWPFEREITIGRDDAVAGACITLDRYISRRHAQVREDEGRLVLADLESRNGTRLDGDAPVTAETTLEPGERFIIGRTLLRVVKGAS
jgi:pSer/pThr/pTyr-binding forkhead associated (FHA) protein